MICLQDLDVWKHHQVDAFVVVYSLTDRRTFSKAVDLLYDIRELNNRKEAIMLVANKSDLVRCRAVSERGRKIIGSLSTTSSQYMNKISLLLHYEIIAQMCNETNAK